MKAHPDLDAEARKRADRLPIGLLLKEMQAGARVLEHDSDPQAFEIAFLSVAAQPGHNLS